jgi:hypothetical protein
MAGLDLALLGRFQGRLGASEPLTLPTRKSQALLAFLAPPPGRRKARFSRASWRRPPQRNGRSRSRWSRRVIIELRFPPDQT